MEDAQFSKAGHKVQAAHTQIKFKPALAKFSEIMATRIS